jgi:hypothetical protein
MTSGNAGGLIGTAKGGFKGCLDERLDCGLLKSSTQAAPFADRPVLGSDGGSDHFLAPAYQQS